MAAYSKEPSMSIRLTNANQPNGPVVLDGNGKIQASMIPGGSGGDGGGGNVRIIPMTVEEEPVYVLTLEIEAGELFNIMQEGTFCIAFPSPTETGSSYLPIMWSDMLRIVDDKIPGGSISTYSFGVINALEPPTPTIVMFEANSPLDLPHYSE